MERLLATPDDRAFAAALRAVPAAGWPELRRRLEDELSRALPESAGEEPYRVDLARLELEWRRRAQRELVEAEARRRAGIDAGTTRPLAPAE